MESNLALQDEARDELIDGVTVMMSPRPKYNHNRVASNIFSLFDQYLKGKRCTPIADGTDLYLSEKDRFVPDMMVVCDPEKLHLDGVHGAPDLVVEVLSPGTSKNDRKHKMAVYERCGVREYWIVDADSKSIEQYLAEDGRLVLHEVYTVYPPYMLKHMTDEERAAVRTSFRCSLFDDLDISLDDVFSRMLGA